MIIRYSKITFCFFLAVFCFLVFLGNIIDYNTNYQFVQHVMQMDTIFPDSVLQYRAIKDSFSHQFIYFLIILGEGVIAFFFFLGTLQLWKARKKSPQSFHEAKAIIFFASAIAFFLWFFGFMTVGGEWFLMWQSKIWNGQQAAFRIYITILVVLVLIMQPE